MPEWFVACGGVPVPPRRRETAIELDVDPNADPRKRVNLKLDDFARALVDNIPDVVVDALEVAAYVYSADRLVRRGTPQMSRMGADWRRSFRFSIPVRCPEIWSSPDVLTGLTDALSFLSEDDFAFDFVRGQADRGISQYLGFSDPDAHVISPDNIILFSGGLDSLAGVLDKVLGDRTKAVLVTHKSSTTVAHLQDELVQELRGRSPPGHLFYTPVWVRKGDQEPKEHTQRTRSFLFITLGMAVARMFDCNSLLACENGITTFNLPVSEHVIGARASRTTHPRALVQFAKFFSLLFDRQMAVSNPFLWDTKSEVLNRISQHQCSDLIAKTVSCAGVRDLSMTGKQCGVCSQCVERRFSIVAAGLGGCEPEGAYSVDVFRGAHERSQDLTMIEQYVLRGRKLATMTEHGFLASYGQVFRTLPYLPGSQDDNARRTFQLHQRHGRSVVDVVNRELGNVASLDAALELPETSLLAMISSPAAVEAHEDPVEREMAPSLEAAMDHGPVADRRFIMAVDAGSKCVRFEGGPVMRGNGQKLIAALAEQRRNEIGEQLPREEYAFVETRSLCHRFRVSDSTLRQWVSRARRDLGKQFLAHFDYPLDEQDIIQSDIWTGYRLNPYLVLVEPSQIASGTQVSRSRLPSVTTPAPAD